MNALDEAESVRDGNARPPGRHTDERTRLRDAIAHLHREKRLPGDACDELVSKLAENSFNLVVVGQFKRGKTSLINALLGEPLLPVGVVPLTSIVTLLQHGDRLRIEVRYDDGRRESIARELLADFVTERGNPRNDKHVHEVAISYPSSWLETGVRLIDTPGIGSIHTHNTDVAQRFLPKADAVLFLLSVEQPVTRAEADYLEEVTRHAGRVFLVMNKADLVTEAELAECVEFSRQAVAATFAAPRTRRTSSETATSRAADDLKRPAPGVGPPPTPTIFPVSARLALAAQKNGATPHPAQSGFPALTDALRRFMWQEKDSVLLETVARRALRLIAQARFELELERKALQTPLRDLDERLRHFETRQRELAAAREEHIFLLNGERTKLLHELVEKDLARFEADLIRDLETEITRRFEANRKLSSRRLQSLLHEFATQETRSRFDQWRAAEDERLSDAFRAVCNRVAKKLDSSIDELLRFAADLFELPYEAVRGDILWTEESDFYYKFWDEPTSLTMLASSALVALPGVLGRRLVLKRARATAIDMVRTQSGRVRWDFQQRLDKSAQDFRVRMSNDLAAVLQGLERALGASTTMRHGSEALARRRGAEIEQSLAALQSGHAQIEAVMAALVPAVSPERP